MKKLIVSILLAVGLVRIFHLGAEQITKVAVLDYARILSAYYLDSAEARRIEKMKTDFASEVRRLQDEIQGLEERKIAAMARGNAQDELNLESKIQEKKQYYQEYVRIKGNQIQQAVADLGSSNELAREILDKIQFVAETNGFSIVLNRSDPNLLWWGYEVDITELVLQQLIKTE